MINTILNDRYRLDSMLGAGGMGTIYRAHDLLLGRNVAVKVLGASGLGTEGRAHLLHEAQAAARLNHPNIVTIYDAGESQSLPYIVMELVLGESLNAQMPDTIEKQLSVARQICSALEHAHTNGIVHRDLKPENVLILADGTVKLTDFGLARSISSGISTDGLIGGTPFYIPPEIALRQDVDGRADLYSLGVLMYEMATGQLPFTDEDPLAVISQHLYAPVVPPRARKPELPSALDALIVQLLSKQPQDRPSSAEETRQMVELIENIAHLNLPTRPVDLEMPMLNRLARGRLVGREHELALARSIWSRAVSGQGSALLITGEPGIGKTRLTNEMAARVAVTGGRVIYGVCYAEGGSPYSPFAHMLRETILQGSSPSLPDYVLDNLSTIAPELAGNVRQKDRINRPASEQEQIFESLAAWITALTQQSPLMLFIDDINWADSGTLYILRALARRASSLRLLIVMTYREIELVEGSPIHNILHDITRERLAERIKLARFTLQQTREMLSSLLESSQPLDDSLVEAIFRETDGNPFFIEEVTKELIERGKLCYEDVCWVARDFDGIDIPQSVRLTIQSRLARLPEQTQNVLQMAAFLGREFELETLRAALQIDDDGLIEAVENAEKAQIIEDITNRRRFSSLTYSFVHALIPTTLRDQTSTIRQQRMHRQVAAAIESAHPDDGLFFEVLARHYELAGEADHALGYLRKAGKRSLSVYANQEAEKQYRAALELSEPGFEQAELYEGLAEALFRQSGFEEAERCFQKALELHHRAGSYDSVAHLYARRARAAWFLHELERSLAICLEGFEAVTHMGIDPQQTETPGIANLYHETARAYRFVEQHTEALQYCQRALEMSTKLGQIEVQADALATLGILPNLSRESARAALEKSVELADAHGLLQTSIRSHINLAENYRASAMLPLALQQIEQALQNCRQIGMVYWEIDLMVIAIDINLDLGHLETARQQIDTLKERMNGYPDGHPGLLWVHTIEARYYESTGDWQAGLAKYEHCQTLTNTSPYSQYSISNKKNYAEALVHAGQLEEAEKMLLEVLQTVTPESEFDRQVASLLMAVIYAQTGRAVQARNILDQLDLQGLISKNWVFEPLIQWAIAETCAAENRLEEAAAAFQTAVKLANNAGARWWAAYYTYEHAQACARSIDPDQNRSANRLFAQALAEFEEMKADAFVNFLRLRLESVNQ